MEDYLTAGGGYGYADYDEYHGTAATAAAAGMSDYDNGAPPPHHASNTAATVETWQGTNNNHNNDNNNNDDDSAFPKLLLMGPRRSGKTSIQQVVFDKMSPHETLFRLEATQGVEQMTVKHTPLCRFTIWDFPGDYYGNEYHDNNNITMRSSSLAGDEQQEEEQFEGVGMDMDLLHENVARHDERLPTTSAAGTTMSSTTTGATGAVHVHNNMSYFAGAGVSLIFVMDAQDEPYDHVLQSFTNVVTTALRANPYITIEVFINKVDGELFLSDETKYDCRRDIVTQVTEELADAGVDPNLVQIRYHLTSIYDHSIYEALSRVVQRLIPQLPTLENLLNVLVNTSSMEKAYLFDVVSKLYISTDSSPVDMQSVELCSDMIDVVLDVSGIYGLHSTTGNSTSASAITASADDPGGQSLGGTGESSGGADGTTPSSTAAATTRDTNEKVDDSDSPTGIHDAEEEQTTLISQTQRSDEEAGNPDSAYDSESASVIRLSNGMVLYLKEVDQMLALVCITRSENFRKKSLINYNIACLKKALGELMTKPANGGASATSRHGDATVQGE